MNLVYQLLKWLRFSAVIGVFLWGTSVPAHAAQTEMSAMCRFAAGTLGGILVVDAEERTYEWWSEGRQIPLGWSADGESLYTMDFGVLDVPVYAIAEGESAEITVLPSANAALSPDGTRIAYIRLVTENNDTAPQPQIEVFDLASRNTQIVATLSQTPSPLFWSPDGHSIGVVLQAEEGSIVAAFNIETGEQTELAQLEQPLHAALTGEAPRWSPDGQWIALVIEEAGTPAVALVNIEQGTSEMIAEDALYPRWSPDSTRLLYVRDGLNILTLGSGETQTYDVPDLPLLPSWSPDGNQIAYLFAREPVTGVYPNAFGILTLEDAETRSIPLEGEILFHPSSPVWHPLCGTM